MTSTIATLRPVETVSFDHETLTALCDTYGEEAEVFIATVLGEIEAHLTKVDEQAQAGRTDGMVQTCRSLLILGQSIGMRTLEQCADAVLACLSRDDYAALPACIARLTRLGRPESLQSWTVQDSAGTVA